MPISGAPQRSPTQTPLCQSLPLSMTCACKYRLTIVEQPFRPVVVDSVIYLATRREELPGTLGNGHVMALLARTGATIWSVPIDDPQDSVRGGSVGPVFVTDSMAIVAGQN